MHLVDPANHKLSQAHNGRWGEAGRMGAVGGFGVWSRPLYKKHGFVSPSEDDKGGSHERGRWDMHTGGGDADRVLVGIETAVLGEEGASWLTR